VGKSSVMGGYFLALWARKPQRKSLSQVSSDVIQMTALNFEDYYR